MRRAERSTLLAVTGICALWRRLPLPLATSILWYATGKNRVGPDVSLTGSERTVSCWHNGGTAAQGRVACGRQIRGHRPWTTAAPEARPLDERGAASQCRQNVYSSSTPISLFLCADAVFLLRWGILLHRAKASAAVPASSNGAIHALRTQLQHLAAFDGLGKAEVPTLLLQGETGVGKGLVARVSHASGPRAQGPFIEVNCAAIPETMLEAELFGFEAGAFSDAKRAKPGLFEAASGGTLFLDEIEALPLGLQGKLLTALGERRVRRLGAVVERTVDVKLVAATQVDLCAQVQAGRLRADLYHRLAVVVLEIPPLRARGEDILVLAEHLLRRYCRVHGVGPRRLSGAAQVWQQGQSGRAMCGSWGICWGGSAGAASIRGAGDRNSPYCKSGRPEDRATA